MIRLELEDYCYSCPDFEAKQIGPDKFYAGDLVYDSSDIIVTCERIKKCRHIIEFLSKHS